MFNNYAGNMCITFSPVSINLISKETKTSTIKEKKGLSFSSITALSSSNSRLSDNLKRLESFSLLKSDWDGYDANAMNIELIKKSKNIIIASDFQPIISPSGKPSIVFKYMKKDTELYIEILNNIYNSVIWNSDNTFSESSGTYDNEKIIIDCIKSFYTSVYHG